MSQCTFSIDWEDFGQLFARYHLDKLTPPSSALERQTDIILQLLDDANVKATFFVLGMAAQYRPDLVRRIAALGHEIALHGQYHKQYSKLSREEIFDDLRVSKEIAENIIGQSVHGFRAPFFSIREENLYTLEILSEIGLEYDSSICPAMLSRYGIKGFHPYDSLYKLSNGGTIVELPLTILNFMGKAVPISGGRYLRLLPGFVIEKIFQKLEEENQNTMLYMHPYEFDSQRLSVTSNYPAEVKYSKLRVAALNLEWGLIREVLPRRISGLLKKLQFATCIEKTRVIKNDPLQQLHASSIYGHRLQKTG